MLHCCPTFIIVVIFIVTFDLCNKVNPDLLLVESISTLLLLEHECGGHRVLFSNHSRRQTMLPKCIPTSSHDILLGASSTFGETIIIYIYQRSTCMTKFTIHATVLGKDINHSISIIITNGRKTLGRCHLHR